MTFDEIPLAITELQNSLRNIEKILLQKSTDEPNETEKLLSIKEAGKVLNLAVPTIYSYVAKQEIPYCKLGKKLYFLKGDLLQWVKSGRRKTNSELLSEASSQIRIK
jgi:excisionase family DNA binding protein